MLPPINITLEAHGAEQVKQAVAEITSEMRTAAQEARAHADALKVDADAAKKRFQEAARAARDASEDQKDSSRKVANGLKDEADAARDAAKAADENAKALEKINASAVKETTSALKEQVRAAEQARAANESNARAIGASAQRLHQVAMMTPGGGAMAAVMGGGGGMRSQIGDLQAAQRNMAMAGDGGPMAVDVGLLDRASVSAQNLTQNLGGVRNAALGITMIGVGGIMLSNKMGEISMQAENKKAALDNLITSQANHGVAGRVAGDVGKIETIVADVAVKAHLANKDEARQQVVAMLSDEVKTADVPALLESVVRNAQALNKPMSEVGEAFSKAYDEGSLTRLKRCNILFSDQEEASVKAAYGISKAAGQTEFMRVVTAATERDVAGLGKSLSDVQNQTNDNSRAFNDFAVATGEGSARADANLKGIAAGLARIVSNNPALAEGAGEILTYGSYATTAIGGLVSFGAQLGQLYVAYNTLKLAKAADTIATTGNTAAVVVSTGATVADTAATEALAIAEGEAASGAGTEAVAVTGAAGATGLAAIAAGFAGTAFGAMAIGIWAAVAPLLVFVAIALAAAAAMKGLDYWLHHDEDEKLQKNIEAGNATNQKRLDNANAERKKRGQKEITAEQWQAMESDDPNATTPESKPSWKSGGDGSGAPTDNGGTGAAPSMDDLKKMMEDAKSGAAPATPAPSGTAPTIPALPGTGSSASSDTSSDAASSALPASDAAARVTQLQSETNPHGDDIRVLQREKSALKGKSNAAKRDGLQKQIEALQDASRSWHASHTAELRAAHAEKSAADKAARLAASEEKKHEREEAKEARIDSHANLAVEKARIANAREDELDALGEELDKAKEDGNKARIRALTLQIEQVKARQRYDEHMAAAAIETDAYKRKADQEVAQIDLEHDIKKAARVADRTALSAGGGGKDEHDAALRAMLLMSGGSRMPDFAALNPSLRRGNSDVARQDAGPISATATTSVTQSLGGARQLNITIPPVDLGYGGIADLGVN